jgi:hypothetical protein
MFQALWGIISLGRDYVLLVVNYRAKGGRQGSWPKRWYIIEHPKLVPHELYITKNWNIGHLCSFCFRGCCMLGHPNCNIWLMSRDVTMMLAPSLLSQWAHSRWMRAGTRGGLRSKRPVGLRAKRIVATPRPICLRKGSGDEFPRRHMPTLIGAATRSESGNGVHKDRKLTLSAMVCSVTDTSNLHHYFIS